MKRLSYVLSLGLAVALLIGTAVAQRPQHSVKEVMKQGMKSGLLRTVISGQATAAQRQQMIALLESLVRSQPRKGSVSHWRERTVKMYQAAQAGDYTTLKEASRCLTCHKEHK